MPCVGSRGDDPRLETQSPNFLRQSPSTKRLRMQLKRAVSEHSLRERYWITKALPPTPSLSRPQSRQSNVADPAPPSSRGRSFTWTSRHSKKQHSSLDHGRPKNYSSAMTPPPCDLAMNRALLREILDVPPKPADSVFNVGFARRKGSRQLSLGVLQATEAGANELDGPNLSKQKSSLPPKLLILTRDQCLLQYDTTGELDRMPEKILPLGPSSIAIASDSIPGKHWVLSIVRDGRASPTEPTTKAGRPKLFSRGSESKKHVKQMLLIFDSALVFDRWLITIRKEIEALGGLRYRPDSQELDADLMQSPRSYRDLHRHANTATPLSFSFPMKAQDGLSDHASRSSTPNSVRSYQSRSKPPLLRSSTTSSSVQTTTNLDALRDSLTSDGSTWSGTRSSYAESYTAEIVTAERAVPLRDARQGSLPAGNLAGESANRRRRNAPPALTVPTFGHGRSASCAPALPSPGLPRTPTIPVDEFLGMASSPSPRESTVENNSVTAKEMGDWLAKVTKDMTLAFASLKASRPGSLIIPPVPQAANTHLPPNASNQRNQTEGGVDGSNVSNSVTVPLAIDSELLLKPPAYSLAPKRSSSVDFQTKNPASSDPTSSADEPVPSTEAQQSEDRSASLQAPTSNVQSDGQTRPRSYSKSVAEKKKLSISKTTTLSAEHDSTLQRSPAVTDVHFATRFGLDSPFEKASVQIGGESLDFPMTSKTAATLSPPLPKDQENSKRSPASDSCNKTAANLSPPLPKDQEDSKETPALNSTPKRHPGHKKSLSGSVHRMTAPISAPPTGPLPAVPQQSSSSATKRNSPDKAVRNRSISSRASSTKKKHTARAQSETIQHNRNDSLSPLASNPASASETHHARNVSFSKRDNLNPQSSKPIMQRAPASVAVVPQSSKPAPLKVVPPVTPEPISSPSTPTAAVSQSPVSPISLFTPQDGLTALPVTMEIKGYPFPLVIHSE